MFSKKRRSYKTKRNTQKKRSPTKMKTSSPYQILKSDLSDLPTWYKEGLPKVKRTIKRRYKPIVRKKSYKSLTPIDIKFRDVLYPAWVGTVPYPKSVDLIQGRYKYGLADSGVGQRKQQELWSKHLTIMKEALPSVPKIPNTRELWSDEQIDILWNFYKKANPTFLVKRTYSDGVRASKYDKLINTMGPFVVDREIRDNYELTTKEYLMGEKLIDLKLKPHKFKLKKGTYLFHGSPQYNLQLDRLIKPDAISEHLGFNSFIFFGLSAAISLWYTVERFSKQAILNKTPGEFEAYLYVYKLNKDLEFQYIEDDIIYNQESSVFRQFCNKTACLHPQFAYHSIEQLNNARGPVELDWELTIPIKQLDKTNIQLIGKYYIDVLHLLKNSTKNIDQFDPISAIDFNPLPI